MIKRESISLNKYEIYNYLTNGGKKLTNLLGFQTKLSEADGAFKDYLKDIIVKSELAQSMDGKAVFIIRRLFKAYMNNPQQLTSGTIITTMIYDKQSKIGDTIIIDETKSYASLCNEARKYLDERIKKGDIAYIHILLRTICDYISGMTDQYALQQFNKLYETQV